MSVKIKLARLGKIRTPQYRVIVADARTRRNGRAIENVGLYQPKENPSFIEIDSERVQYWLSVGAQPTEPVQAILKVTGDWQKFKGESGAEGTLKVAEEKPSKLDVFNKALEDASNEPTAEAITTKRKAEKAKAEEDAEAKAAADAKAAEEAGSAEASAESAEGGAAEETAEVGDSTES